MCEIWTEKRSRERFWSGRWATTPTRWWKNTVSEGEAVLVKRKVTKKRVPPDIQAAKMLLDGAPPLTSLSDEQLQREKERLLLLLKEEQT